MRRKVVKTTRNFVILAIILDAVEAFQIFISVRWRVSRQCVCIQRLIDLSTFEIETAIAPSIAANVSTWKKKTIAHP